MKDDWLPQGATSRAVKSKKQVYAKWDVDSMVVVALAFSTYLVWDKSTFEYLQGVTGTIAAGDFDLQARLFRKLREDVAAALVVSQGRLISELNRRNGGYRA